MAKRLAKIGVVPDLIVSSPAKRAKKTAEYMAKGTGYPLKEILYIDSLYMGSKELYISILKDSFKEADTVFLVGHNYTITDLAEWLSGVSLTNVPTCGVVSLEYSGKKGFQPDLGAGKLLFFDYPKNMQEAK